MNQQKEEKKKHSLDKFKLLEAYKAKHGHVNVPDDGSKLGTFVMNQRKFYKHFRNGDFEKAMGMTEERISKLESLGLDWTREAEMNNRIKKHRESGVSEQQENHDNLKDGSEVMKSGNSITVDSEVTMSPNILDENEHAQK